MIEFDRHHYHFIGVGGSFLKGIPKLHLSMTIFRVSTGSGSLGFDFVISRGQQRLGHFFFEHSRECPA